ncbi:VC2046/SO_2500 family protein [Celerinatantimonas yamalensis]|uniref:VC2046/SO_2500 family protein n=1 Tax=Celerinatantimonas yamalensis TaxID=559956 RepID=A0ABW9G216_9GAMM
MLPEPIRQSVCCDELQLGARLNQCVESGYQATFSLWLSLLSNDVCDQPQFDFNEAAAPAPSIDWRSYFQLEAEQHHYATRQDVASIGRWNMLTQRGDLRTIQLEQSLNRPALSSAQVLIDDDVLNNLSLLERLKYEQRLNPQNSAAPDPQEAPIEPTPMVNVLTQFDYTKPLTLQTR